MKVNITNLNKANNNGNTHENINTLTNENINKDL